MAFRVLVIGGYGNFGRLICNHLALNPDIELVLAGRDSGQLARAVDELDAFSVHPCKSWCGDAMGAALGSTLRALDIQLVIHTGGPFQRQPYTVARHCIDAGVDYCDLSDCRAFVTGIASLDAGAREAGVRVLSGCSSVPSLSAAIIDEQRQRFARIDSIEHGISSAAKMPGLSTVLGVLAYAGRPIKQLKAGQVHEVPGWMHPTLRKIPGLGLRWLANVDAPDIDVFASRYGARNLRFQAGSGLLAGGVANYLLAWAVRHGLVHDPAPWAARLHRWGRHFERFGNGKSAMFIDVKGVGHDGQPLHMQAVLTALNDKGPQIPSCAAVALVNKMARGYRPPAGARACVGEISVAEYLAAIDEPDNVRLDVRFAGGKS
jgi:hypothetical protein